MFEFHFLNFYFIVIYFFGEVKRFVVIFDRSYLFNSSKLAKKQLNILNGSLGGWIYQLEYIVAS